MGHFAVFLYLIYIHPIFADQKRNMVNRQQTILEDQIELVVIFYFKPDHGRGF